MTSCRKDSFTQSADAGIAFSADTLFFDTVFTTVGSVTQSFKIFNPNDQKLKITSIKLSGGNSSPFKINVNGTSATVVNDEVLNANDSMYVFVQVLINPNDHSQPFVLSDSIEVQYNGNKRWIQLRAFGQNAIFLRNQKIKSDTTWNDSLPIVISGFLQVDTSVTLRVLEGTKIFIHATAPFIVNGTLKAEGIPANPVIFSGDRTDAEYRDLPAAWPGIFFTSVSKDNLLKSVVIKNAYQGVVAEQMPDNNNPKVTISQCVIQNVYDAGILALNSSIAADNSLIVNCGSNVALYLGGKYSFVNCTIASYGSFYIAHKSPVLQLTDNFEQSGVFYTSDMNADFVNCILWGDNGSVENEVLTNKKGTVAFNVLFDHCLYKAKDNISNVDFENSLLNAPPLFDSINTSKNFYNFHFENHPESPAIKSGTPVGFLFDLDGKARTNPPDIGCYER